MTKNNKEGVFSRTEMHRHKHKLEKSRDKKEYRSYIYTFFRVGLVAVVCFMLMFAGIGVASAAEGFNPANDWFTTGGGSIQPISSTYVKNGIMFTSPYSKDVEDINLFTCYWPWNPEKNPVDTPIIRVGIQAMAPDGNPTGTWLGSGIVKPPIDTRQWFNIPLSPAVHLKKDQVYYIVIQWESGTVDDKHYTMFYGINVITGAEVSPSQPYNYGGIDSNVNRKDAYSFVKYFNGASWIPEPNSRARVIYYISFTDGTYFGQPNAHEHKDIHDTTYVGEIITITSYDKMVDQLQCEARDYNQNDALYYSIQEVTISGNTITVLDTLSSGVMVAKGAGSPSPSYRVETKDLEPPILLKKGQTYLIKLSSPSGLWASDASSANSVLYSGVYPDYVSPFPAPNDYWLARNPRTGETFEHLASMTYDGRNSYLVRTRWGNPDYWLRESLTDLPFRLRFVGAPSAGTISGTVTNTTGAPIQGATVQANSHSNITNTTGGYTITLPVGNYSVTASKTGYQSQSQENVQVLENQTTTVNFQLTEASDLIGLWHFDEGSGIIASDSSRYGNDGTLTNMDPATDRVDGKIGKALEFDGTDDYVDCGNDASLDLGLSGDSFTLEAWIKPNQASPSDWGVVIAKDGLTTNNDRNYWFGQNAGTPGIYFGTRNEADNGRAEWKTNDGLTAGAWNHIAVVWDRTANDVILYIDGTVKSWNVGDAGAPFDIPSAYDTNVSIGLSGDINAFPFNGTIDEVKIYNRALNAEEIKADYLAGLEDITLPETTITSGPDRTINNSVISFSWTGSDNVTPTSQLLYSYKLEGYGDSWSSWTSVTTKYFNGLANYDYTLKVKAKDEAGNEDPTPAERPFLVDIPVTVPRYDVNADGKVDVLDITIVAQHYGETTNLPYPRYDVNANGKVDALDITIVTKHCGEITN